MTSNSFGYDIAFSFTSEDEALATKLNDLLQVEFETFLYSKKQEIVAGTDGEQSFGAVFGQDARFVVILYRANWGNTPWTRIEETAIRNRAFEEGYDFTLFMPVERGVELPKWVPRNRLYLGFERWGIKGVASVIEARVRDAGGTPRVESPVQQALRLQRKIEFEGERKQFLQSTKGVEAATAAMDDPNRRDRCQGGRNPSSSKANSLV